MLHDPGSWLGHVSTRGGQGQNYSFGQRGWDQTYATADDYIRRQTVDNGRVGMGLVVQMNPFQDAKFDQCMSASRNDGSEYSEVFNNCTTGAQMCLFNAGVPLQFSITPGGFQESLFNTGAVVGVNWYSSP